MADEGIEINCLHHGEPSSAFGLPDIEPVRGHRFEAVRKISKWTGCSDPVLPKGDLAATVELILPGRIPHQVLEMFTDRSEMVAQVIRFESPSSDTDVRKISLGLCEHKSVDLGSSLLLTN